jgi:hypothetical protein
MVACISPFDLVGIVSNGFHKLVSIVSSEYIMY